MHTPSYGSMYPATAYAVALVGGGLILAEGLAVVAEALSSTPLVSRVLPGANRFPFALGAVGVVLGLAILATASRLKSHPASSRMSGVLIIGMSLVSVPFGGGFFLGLLIAVIGGILAATWNPRVVPQPAYGHPAYGLPLDQPVATTQWGPPAAPPFRLGSARRVCSTCGSLNRATSPTCEMCGASMS
ncbi:MAG: zinc finger Ran-binding domain-containing protein [Candidatus Lutacidiplasmatales archaeon]